MRSRTRLKQGDHVDHFRVMRLLGQGGMGEVYLARDTRLGRKVALKLLLAREISDSARARLLAEARATARFNHPNIVTIYHVGEHDGCPYLALEYLEGQTLRERAQREPLGVQELLRVGLAIARALAEAHRHSTLHRDLKPANVIISRDGQIRVLDFGLATDLTAQAPRGGRKSVAVQPEEVDAGDEGTGAYMGSGERDDSSEWEYVGTPPYMAPEQWLLRPSTGAVDVWALGVILFELVAGRRPYTATTQTELGLAVTSPGPVPSLPPREGVPPALTTLVRRCLSKGAEERPSAAEVADALDELVHAAQKRDVAEQCPFRGLLPFSEHDAAFFFGRDAEIAAFLERLRNEPVMPVVGPTGAGKSSLVQAGVIPRLKEQGHWHILTLRPGSNPFRTLATRICSAQRAVSVRPDRSEKTGEERTVRMPGGGEDHSLRASSGDGEVSVHSDRSEKTGEERTVRMPGGGERFDSGWVEDSAVRASPGDILELVERLQRSPRQLGLELQRLADRVGGRVLLFVDQLEELFTLVESGAERRNFMRAICLAADDAEDPIRVVFTLRDDFLGRAAEESEAREALSRLTVMRHPAPEALRETLTKPLEAVGYAYDSKDLVETMLADIRGERSCLPLLQFALRTLWDRRDQERGLLLQSEYVAMGGVAGVLADHADAVLDALTPEQVLVARDVLLRLVTAQDTRQVRTMGQLLDGLDASAGEIVNRLAQARLLSVRRSRGGKGDHAEVELAHEALVGTWSVLVRWTRESRQERAFLSEVTQAAELWESRGRRQEEAWQGQALEEATRILDRADYRLPGVVAAFLEAGSARERRRMRLRRLQRLGVSATAAAVAIVSLLIAWAFATKERDTQRQKGMTEVALQAAEVQRAQAQREGARAAWLQGDLLEARAKLRGSLETQDSPLARSLWWKLEKSPLVWQNDLGNVVYDVAFSPDGTTVAVACQDTSVYLINTTTLASEVLRGHTDQVIGLTFSQDGQWVASGSLSGELGLWNLKTRSRRLTKANATVLRALAFSADDKMLTTAAMDGTIQRWDVATGEERTRFHAEGTKLSSVAILAGGERTATGHSDGTVRIWDVPNKKMVRTMGRKGAEPLALAISMDGQEVAVGTRDHRIDVWNMAKKAPVKSIASSGAFRTLAFAPDVKRLAVGYADGGARIWDIERGEMVLPLPGQDGGVYGLAFSKDGRALASGSNDHMLRMWNVSGDAQPRLEQGHDGATTGIAFRNSDHAVVSGGADASLRFWDLRTGLETRAVSVLGQVRDLALSPDEKLVAVASTDLAIQLIDADSGATITDLRGHTDRVLAVRFSPDSRMLASAGMDRTVRLWDTATGSQLRVLRGHARQAFSVAFDASGRTVASSGTDGTVRVWSVADGREVARMDGNGPPMFGVSFHPTNTDVLAVGAADGGVRLWRRGAPPLPLLAKVPGRVYAVAYHPTEPLLGLAVSDFIARTVDITTKETREMRGHRSEVNNFVFSGDGKLFATTSDDGTVRLWDVRSGRQSWYAPILLQSPPELFSHRGWERLDSSDEAASKSAKWRTAIAKRARLASESPDGDLLCVGTHSDALEIWDRKSDELLHSIAAQGLRDLAATSNGCVVRVADSGAATAVGRAELIRSDGSVSSLGATATAIAVNPSSILVAAPTEITLFDPATGKEQQKFEGSLGTTAMARIDSWLVVGNRDGSIELVPTSPKQKAPSFQFESTPSSPVVSIVQGPMGTVIAGYANGLLGLWSLDNGTRLEYVRLHGPVLHVLLKGSKLYAATELGGHAVVDLSVFYLPYCELLRSVWETVPVVWEEGLPVVRPRPTAGRCVVADGG